MVKRVKAFFNRFGLLTGIVLASVALFVFSHQSRISSHNHSGSFQQAFQRQELGLETLTQKASHDFGKNGISAIESRYPASEGFFLHIYRNDSLIFWNTNELPIYALADPHFPSEGLVHLQNGWYYTKIIKKGTIQVVGSFYIQHTYPYTNAHLQNTFNPLLASFAGSIVPEEKKGSAIYSRNGSYLFSFEEVETLDHENSTETVLFTGLLLIFLLLWVQLNRWFKGYFAPLVLAAIFCLLRFLALKNTWFSGFDNSSLFDPSILALSEWTPNLGELLLSFLLFLVACNALVRMLKGVTGSGKTVRIFTLAGMLLLPFLYYWMSFMGQEIVENSSIPLQLDQIFSLTRYSLIVLLMIGIAGFTFVAIVYEMMQAFLRSGWKLSVLFIIWAVSGVLFVSISLGLRDNSINSALWPVLISGVILFVTWRFKGKWNFSVVLFALFLFSIGATSSIHEFARIKERQERELYANQLADEKDLNTELEYTTARQRLLDDPYMERFRVRENRPESSELKEALERRVFNGFWERYDMDFFYFDKNDTITRFNGKRLRDLEKLISRHGEVSEVDTSLFFINDYTSQYSYVFLQELKLDSSSVLFFGTLKSKKIPEEIGFPRLLISDKAKVFESLGTYSIAKYYSGRIVARYGSYSFPVEAGVMKEVTGRSRAFFDKDNFNHFLLKRTDRDMIILSKQNTGWVDWVTTVAFLFVSYGFLLAVFLLFQSRNTTVAFRGLSLAVKIQVVLVGLVFVSLLGFSFGSGTFVKNQYAEYTNDLIREKVHSVGAVSRLRMGELASVDEAQKGIDLNYYLRNWSHIFVTDVNIYDLRGQLVGSSRPKIYNIGLLSEQMNPDARLAMMTDKKSEFIHQESIGQLRYLSAYAPFFNNEGKLIAYINLQHFDQQNEFENQIQRFLVAIINVFMLLLALSIVSAIFVSSWLTSPLRMIQRSFSRMELGKNNQPIAYHSNDEIGDLVREYNQKLADLEVAAVQLAQSERESAWREMAKQVAHEIKNPLTPMKLSIQQLLRVYDPNDPDSRQKIERVSNSVIEQIDALTSIANAFANFAKMPQPKMECIDMRAFLESIVAVFDVKDSCEVHLETSEQPAMVEGDREMLLRVMNNLVTNAIQAIPVGRKGDIRVELEVAGGEVIISVSDNGTGIPQEQLATVFEPYFTTKSTGTGLGLAMVRQIVEGHNGTIMISETGDTGTTVRLVLPAVELK